jgi:hypothetical protein
MREARQVIAAALFLGAAFAAAVVGLSVGQGSSRAADGEVDLQNLPIGDGKAGTTGPRRGWIYACRLMQGGGGAFQDGSWIHSDGTFDITAKPTVDGAVEWPSARVRISRTGSGRVRITGNGLPANATTGVFPIASTDDAHEPRITNDDLDACHGRTSTIKVFGRRTRTYHYDATAEYPYTIGCFRGAPLRTGPGHGASSRRAAAVGRSPPARRQRPPAS